MMGWEPLVYSFICGAMLMMSALGLESAAVMPSLVRWDRRFFLVFFGALTMASAVYFLELIAFVAPALRILAKVAYFVQSLCATIPFPMLSVYLLHCCGEDYRKSLLVRVETGLFVTFFVLLAISPFSSAIYDISLDGTMVRGPVYGFMIALLLAMLLFVLLGTVRRRETLSRRHYRAFLVCLVPVMAALLIHLFVSAFLLIDVSLTVSAYSAYRIIVLEATERDLRQQHQIAAQRTSIAVLQMRPHFIYNTMSSIYYLCKEDPDLAQKITLDFTTYLRKNFTAIVSEEAIPFAEELEHTRAYLAVEQAQYEDDLIVDYDVPHTQFRVPPLTLQPLVENAIKHGMDPDSGPLHIVVRTLKTDAGSKIVVENDGTDYAPANDSEPHTALANMRQRLDVMCGGTLAIAPREGGGTVVEVTIPQHG